MTQYQTDFEGHEKVHKVPSNPDCECFIYVLMDDNENIVYVGQSKNPVSRMAIHTKDKEFTKFKFFRCDPEKVNQIEFALYAKHKPKFNRVPPQDDTYFSLDSYKRKTPELRGVISYVRRFIRENPVETRAGKYPIEYLERMKAGVAK